MGDTAITFTIADVLWICGGICTIAAALAVIVKAVAKAAEPETIQNQRLDALEEVQTVQDGAIEDIGAVLSDIVEE